MGEKLACSIQETLARLDIIEESFRVLMVEAQKSNEDAALARAYATHLERQLDASRARERVEVVEVRSAESHRG